MTADEFAAIEQARALMLRPAQVALLRGRDFPSGMRVLLRAAAGDSAALEIAAQRTGDTQAALREASVFFVQQVMLSDTSDSYRILGVGSDAPAAEIKAHYGLLMRWMHPDRNPDGWDAVFVERVNRAWNDLRTTDRRTAFDAARLGPDTVEQEEDWAEGAAPFRPPPVREASPFRPVPDAASTPLADSKRMSPRLAAGAAIAAVMSLALFVVWPGFDDDSAVLEPLLVDADDGSLAAPASVGTSVGNLPEIPPAPAAATRPQRATAVTVKPVIRGDSIAANPRVPRGSEATGASPADRGARVAALDARTGARADPGGRALAAERGVVERPAAASRVSPDSIADASPVFNDSSSMAAEASPLRQMMAVNAEALPEPMDVAPQRPAAPDLDQASLLIGRFARAYQRGDIDAMSALFAEDAKSQGGGIAQIREAYDRLFEQTSHRSISIRDIQWQIEDERARAVGHFEISQARDKQSKARVSRGTIRFDIEQRQDQLLIARLEHSDRAF